MNRALSENVSPQECPGSYHADWNTFRMLSMRLINSGLEFKIGTDRFDMQTFVAILSQPGIFAGLKNWLEILTGMVGPARLDDRIVSHVLAAFVFSMYKMDFIVSRLLKDSSKQLVLMITMAMKNAQFSAAKLFEYLADFRQAYEEWHTKHSQQVVNQARRKAVFHNHQVSANRRRALQVKETYIPSLLEQTSIVLCMPLDVVGEKILKCRQMKMIDSMRKNEFWGDGGTSVLRLIHELMLDENFTVSLENTFPSFLHKHSPPSYNLVADFKSIILWPLRDPVDVWAIASIDDKTPIVDTVDRIVPLLENIVPTSDLGRSWEEVRRDDPNAVLEFMVFAATSFRFWLSVVDVELCRANIKRHAHGFYNSGMNMIVADVTSTTNTEPWLRRVLSTYSDSELHLVKSGDPYALLGVHDHAIIDFAIDGDLMNRVPETLMYDVHRLQDIRADIATVGREKVRELVSNNNECINPAIEELRNIVFVSRFQYGEPICTLAREIAENMLEMDEVLDKAIHWGSFDCDGE